MVTSLMAKGLGRCILVALVIGLDSGFSLRMARQHYAPRISVALPILLLNCFARQRYLVPHSMATSTENSGK